MTVFSLAGIGIGIWSMTAAIALWRQVLACLRFAASPFAFILTIGNLARDLGQLRKLFPTATPPPPPPPSPAPHVCAQIFPPDLWREVLNSASIKKT